MAFRAADLLEDANGCRSCRAGNTLHTGGVTGSIPVAPISLFKDLAASFGWARRVQLNTFIPSGLQNSAGFPLSAGRNPAFSKNPITPYQWLA